MPVALSLARSRTRRRVRHTHTPLRDVCDTLRKLGFGGSLAASLTPSRAL